MLASGTRLGPYVISAPIGAGGMGEVYRATDTNLARQVAIKILPDAFASDPERLARFEREARTLATLNHRNIAQIYGFEKSDGIRMLVMELVDGPTLAERIAQAPIPVHETLAIAKQIAEALEAAHENGIIHRDLKPANIKVRDDGTVKVLDFGLAKALDPVSVPASATASPTTSPASMTEVGVLLGTAAYMAPEQARGRPVDRRADIWAFGCVLYEMLTGRAAFAGDTFSDTIAAVLDRELDWKTLPGSTPHKVRDLLRRCLHKDPTRRLHDIADARIEIDEVFAASIAEAAASTVSPMIVQPTLEGRRVVAFAALILGAVSLAGTAVWFGARSLSEPAPVTRFVITSRTGAPLAPGPGRDVAITRDGTRLIYIGAKGTALFVRAFDQVDPTPLTGLGTPQQPFISPDGQWIGFADGVTALKKVPLSGGPAVTIGRLDAFPRGATWGPDDTIVFATTNGTTGLQRISAAGGTPTVLTRPNRAAGELDHVWPEFLPDGDAVFFTITSTTGGLDTASVAVLDLRTGAQTILLRGGSHAQYVATGHLLYGAGSTLRAVPFDRGRRAITGTAVPVVRQVDVTGAGALQAAVADDGTLVYQLGFAGVGRTLVWVDREGQETPIATPPRVYNYPRVSPDGTRIALWSNDEDSDLWIWDLVRATLTRVTSDPVLDNYPVWTPDSRRLVFSSDRAGARNLFTQAADGTGEAERLTESRNRQDATSILPDGSGVLFSELVPATNFDVMLLPLATTGKASALVQTPAAERNGEVSPDGRWLAYEANDSGRFEVYVRPFPGVSRGRWQVSTGGGAQPLWARNGQELFYRAPTGAVMRVEVSGGSSWAAAPPTQLFGGAYYAGSTTVLGRTYDVSPDARRFLMIKPSAAVADEATTAPASLIVVRNWFEELKRLVPTN